MSTFSSGADSVLDAVSTSTALRPFRVLILSTGLGTGGAERMLVKLVAALRPHGCEFVVVSLLDSGTQAETLRALGATVHELRLKQLRGIAVLPCRLRRIVRQASPDVIQGWMYHGNLVACAARWMAGSGCRLFWGVRQTFYGMKLERPLTRLVIRANARLSGLPEAVIYNSALSLRQHQEAGFSPDRGIVIPNGFDMSRFRPSDDVRVATRTRLGLPQQAEIVGLVARDHPMKDHAGFLRAAARVAQSRPATLFVLAGTGVNESNTRIMSLVADVGLGQRVRLLGEVVDVERLMPAFDVAVLSSSWGEGFPNVLGEALACAVPCVSTDVGDAGAIIGDAGRLVPRSDSKRLAEAIIEILDLGATGRRALGEAGRRRMQSGFSLESVAGQYLRLYREGYRPESASCVG
jgi:glycosyltransferase involved in cell wall biosynthesis